MPKKKKGYKRVMLKLSGQALGNGNGEGIDTRALNKIAKEIANLNKHKIEAVVVIGGGNIWRYRDTKSSGIERTTSDYMGMMATIMNSVALQSALEHIGVY